MVNTREDLLEETMEEFDSILDDLSKRTGAVQSPLNVEYYKRFFSSATHAADQCHLNNVIIESQSLIFGAGAIAGVDQIALMKLKELHRNFIDNVSELYNEKCDCTKSRGLGPSFPVGTDGGSCRKGLHEE